MTRYNLIFVLNKNETKLLMCKRIKDPYKGKYNLVGGKVEDGEELLESAYRELFEETAIRQTDVELQPYIDFVWHPVAMQMHVFIGKLDEDVTLVEEVHPLEWIDIDADFFDTNTYAGEGNIGHMVAIYKLRRKEIFPDE